MKRLALIALGWFSLVLGTIGIFVPLLPTTVFIILASWCFARSSRRFHTWLHAHPRLGPLLNDWEAGHGIPLKAKRRAIVLLWCSIGLSIYLVKHQLVLSVFLFAIGIAVSIYLYRLPSPELKQR